MLNEYLDESTLQDSLKDFLESLNFILVQIYPDRTRSIFSDKKLMGALHHSLNLDKYQQKSFRQMLMQVAPDTQIKNFAEKLNIKFNSHKEIQSLEFRNKLAEFTWGNNIETRSFVEVFEYPEYLIPSVTTFMSDVETLEPLEQPFKQLKDYQASVVYKALEHVKNPNSKFLIHMPTGAGKTRVAMEIISQFLNEKEGRQIVWLADRRELCEQAMETFIQVWRHLGKFPIKIYRVWGNHDIPQNITGTAFVVTMYQKIRGSKGSMQIKADLVVPDEAHNAVAVTYSSIINDLKDRRIKQTRIMGLTATPGRGSGIIRENKNLSDFFNSAIIGIESDGGIIETLQKKGILARCTREVLNTDQKYSLTKEQWKKLSQSLENEFPSGLLKEIANDQSRNVKIVIKLNELSKENYKRILVFCGSTEQSKLLTGLMMVMGNNAAYVDANSPTDYRKETVTKFHNGELQFLFNHNVFTAGFDVPKIDAVVIARPTTSVVLYGQMIGRGMRGPTMGGTAEFTLVDVVDDIITEYGGLDSVHEYFTEYWE